MDCGDRVRVVLKLPKRAIHKQRIDILEVACLSTKVILGGEVRTSLDPGSPVTKTNSEGSNTKSRERKKEEQDVHKAII